MTKEFVPGTQRWTIPLPRRVLLGKVKCVNWHFSLPEEWRVHAIRGKGLQLGLIVQESWTSFKKLEGKAIREKWNMVGTSA